MSSIGNFYPVAEYTDENGVFHQQHTMTFVDLSNPDNPNAFDDFQNLIYQGQVDSSGFYPSGYYPNHQSSLVTEFAIDQIIRMGQSTIHDMMQDA